MATDLYLGLFKPEEIKGRYDDLYLQCKYFADAETGSTGLPLFVDPGHLLIVVKCAYIDVARYKAFHFDDPRNERLGAAKRSAYLTKWMVRVKPIYPIWPPELASRMPDIEKFMKFSQAPYATINEFFSITYALNSINDELSQMGKNEVSLPAWKAKNIMYDLYYRDMSADAILALYESLIEGAQSEFVGK